MQLNVHFHVLVPDGAFDDDGVFVADEAPNDDDVRRIMVRAGRRVMSKLHRFFDDDDERRREIRLCAYGARGAVASSRLTEIPDGRFAYDMKRALPDGRRQLVMTGVELLDKLVPLIPPTYANLTRFITAR